MMELKSVPHPTPRTTHPTPRDLGGVQGAGWLCHDLIQNSPTPSHPTPTHPTRLQELPETWEEYKALVGKWFPGGIYDTKYLAGGPFVRVGGWMGCCAGA